MNPLNEYRGANFALGGDSDVISVPNILRNYSPNLVEDSKGTHLIEVCYGVLCPSNYTPTSDQLNAAQSGAQALNIDKQGGLSAIFYIIWIVIFLKNVYLFYNQILLVNYLVEQVSQRKDIDVQNDWKVTIFFTWSQITNAGQPF